MPTIIPPTVSNNSALLKGVGANPSAGSATQVPPGIIALPAGTVLRGNIAQIDGRGNAVLSTAKGDVSLQTELPVKLGSEIALRITTSTQGIQAKIISINGLTPQDFTEKSAQPRGQTTQVDDIVQTGKQANAGRPTAAATQQAQITASGIPLQPATQVTLPTEALALRGVLLSRSENLPQVLQQLPSSISVPIQRLEAGATLTARLIPETIQLPQANTSTPTSPTPTTTTTTTPPSATPAPAPTATATASAPAANAATGTPATAATPATPTPTTTVAPQTTSTPAATATATTPATPTTTATPAAPSVTPAAIPTTTSAAAISQTITTPTATTITATPTPTANATAQTAATTSTPTPAATSAPTPTTTVTTATPTATPAAPTAIPTATATTPTTPNVATTSTAATVAASTTPAATNTASPSPVSTAPSPTTIATPTATSTATPTQVATPTAAVPTGTTNASATTVPAATSNPTAATTATPTAATTTTTPTATLAPTTVPAAVPAATTAAQPPLPTQLAQGQLTATVIGQEQSGDTVVKTALGAIKVSIPSGSGGQANLPVGTTFTLQLQNISAPQTLGQAIAAQISNAPAPLSELSMNWRSLQETVELLAQVQPAIAAQLLENVIPKPGAKMATSMLFFLSALRGGDVGKWLGDDAIKILEQNNRGDLIRKLTTEFGTLRQFFTDSPSPNWQAAFVPVHDGEKWQQARMFLKKEPQGAAAAESGGTRFIMEVELTQMGPMQFDGLVRKRAEAVNFDLIIRSRNTLTDTDRQNIRDIYEGSAELTGFKGGISFQVTNPFPVLPMKDILADAPDVMA